MILAADGTLADARWSLAVRWWVPDSQNVPVLHVLGQVDLEDLMQRLGISGAIPDLGPPLFALLTPEEIVALTLVGAVWDEDAGGARLARFLQRRIHP
jgi:hypothetical protein